MLEHQIRGMIAISVILAFIPFITYFMPFLFDSKIPVLSTPGSASENSIIEVVSEDGESGIYFAEPGTTASQLFSQARINGGIAQDLRLQNGVKINLVPKAGHRELVIEKMEASKRLALGLPVDINRVSFDELRLIPGIGDAMAANIVEERLHIGRFEKLDQLLKIRGIKGKKLSKLRRYLYVDHPVNEGL